MHMLCVTTASIYTRRNRFRPYTVTEGEYKCLLDTIKLAEVVINKIIPTANVIKGARDHGEAEAHTHDLL